MMTSKCEGLFWYPGVRRDPVTKLSSCCPFTLRTLSFSASSYWPLGHPLRQFLPRLGCRCVCHLVCYRAWLVGFVQHALRIHSENMSKPCQPTCSHLSQLEPDQMISCRLSPLRVPTSRLSHPPSYSNTARSVKLLLHSLCVLFEY